MREIRSSWGIAGAYVLRILRARWIPPAAATAGKMAVDHVPSPTDRGARVSGAPTSDAAGGDLACGVTVDGYRVERVLGRGGAGVVYAAEEVSSGRRVALKVLRLSFADDPEAARRFEREALAASAIAHPGVVKIERLGRLDDGRPYLVIELLEGRSLREELDATGPLAPARAWRIVRPVALALGAAHRAGVIHRDIKPDNIFLAHLPGQDAPVPRVLDLGLARVSSGPDGEALARLTQTGIPIGTPAYMAPELWWGAAIEPATDEYALGLTLFELIAGQRAFASAQYVELMQGHLHEPPPTLASRGFAVPPGVEDLLARSLAKDAGQRHGSMTAFLDAGDHAFASFGDLESLAIAPEITPGNGWKAPRGSPDGLKAPGGSPHASGEVGSPARRMLSYGVVLGAALGLAGAVGYAGPARWHPVEWVRIAGQGAWLVLIVAGVAAGSGLVAARRGSESARSLPVWTALLPALAGAIGTYTGWAVVLEAVARLPLPSELPIFNVGMYEANAARFLGLVMSWALCVALLGARPGVPLPAPSSPDRVARVVLVGLGVLTAGAVLAGAASAAFIGAAAMLAFGLRARLPRGPQALEISRSGWLFLALLLALGAAATRLEGREAILWDPEWQGTRAARAAEIAGALGERRATAALGLAAVGAALWLEFRRFHRFGPLAPQLRAAPAAVRLLTLLFLGGMLDAGLHAWVLGRRAELRARLEPRFALFARLSPPSADTLPARLVAPGSAPALQLTRDVVALDGVGLVRIEALGEATVRQLVRLELSKAVSAVERPKPGEPELLVAIDREVRWGVAREVLGLARGLGVRRVQLLFTRGEAPSLSPSSPPEASYLLASDFAALPAHLTARHLDIPADLPFGAAARLLVALPAGETECELGDGP
jgi:serine/threonine protein kinase